MTDQRRYSIIDQFCLNIDHIVRALGDHPQTTGRPYPVIEEKDSHLSVEESQHSAALMRVNHAGEICAQALYHGQALVSRCGSTRKKLQQAAIEEGDHLAWCSQRLRELSSHTSYLNPLWYLGSFLIGMTAGLAGDQWSLGFVVETEKQVVKHLEGHLQVLPGKDRQSHEIIAQMRQDEEKHRQEAIDLGAATLPHWIQRCMTLASQVMVKVAYWM